MAMMRPKRLRIISLVAARASRKVAVRLMLMTSSQSSSRSCTKRLSRVMPALATRISSWPIAASAAGTSASTSSALDKLQGSTCTRSPSLAANSSSTAWRVPEIATVAPCACSACAIAPPMPPVAPVTSALLPVRSNIEKTPLGLLGSGQCVLGGGDVVRTAHGNADRAVRDALDEPGQHLAGADLEEAGDALAGHSGDRFAPAHRAGDLLDQTAADLVGIGDGARQRVRHQGCRRRLDRHLRQRLGHGIGGGLHQLAMERCGHRQQHRAHGALDLGNLDGAIDRGLVAGDDHLTAAIVVGGLADLP